MTEVIKVEDCGENIGNYDVPIYKAIVIPKNATNGDMIKALFSREYEALPVNIDRASWWNAPYKRGDTE